MQVVFLSVIVSFFFKSMATLSIKSIYEDFFNQPDGIVFFTLAYNIFIIYYKLLYQYVLNIILNILPNIHNCRSKF